MVWLTSALYAIIVRILSMSLWIVVSWIKGEQLAAESIIVEQSLNVKHPWIGAKWVCRVQGLNIKCGLGCENASKSIASEIWNNVKGSGGKPKS